MHAEIGEFRFPRAVLGVTHLSTDVEDLLGVVTAQARPPRRRTRNGALLFLAVHVFGGPLFATLISLADFVEVEKNEVQAFRDFVLRVCVRHG